MVPGSDLQSSWASAAGPTVVVVPRCEIARAAYVLSPEA